MPFLPAMKVMDWCALEWRDGAGSAEAVETNMVVEKSIPAGSRRRLGAFERSVVRCVLGLARDGDACSLTLGSRYGNLTSAETILRSVGIAEAPSPTLFSHSVLNAGCGVTNQIRKDRSPHSAISAGLMTAHCTLTDSWLQMSTDTDLKRTHLVVLIDTPATGSYRELMSKWEANVCIGLRLEMADAKNESPVCHSLGCEGYLSLLSSLKSGLSEMVLRNSHWSMI